MDVAKKYAVGNGESLSDFVESYFKSLKQKDTIQSYTLSPF
jgi:hypothetical protein